ncbi:MAG: hypothetical protein MK214_09965 [Thalassotalea sp.]|nr:hypothetical protein [Thalassotalea sp.]
MKSKIVSSESIIRINKLKGISILTVFLFVFLNNTLPENYSNWWDSYIVSGIPETIQFIVPSIVLSTLISIYFYSGDPLFKKKGEINTWIKTLFPSNLLIEKYAVNEHEANSLWFKYFNQWQHKEHPNHTFLKKSHSFSYNARLVYFLIFTFDIFSIISLILFVFSLFIKAQISYLIILLIFSSMRFVLSYFNKPAKLDENGIVISPPTGVWHSVESSFLESKSRFDREVVSKCETIDMAEELIESMSEK